VNTEKNYKKIRKIRKYKKKKKQYLLFDKKKNKKRNPKFYNKIVAKESSEIKKQLKRVSRLRSKKNNIKKYINSSLLVR